MAEISLKIKGGSFLYSELSPEDLFTPEDFSDEHKMIAQTAKQFIEKEVDPFHEEIEEQNIERIVSLLKQAGDLGLLAHSIPDNYGGLGLDKVSKSVVGEVIGRTSGYGVAHSNHTCIATLPITYFGSKAQKEKYLPKLASGEYLGAYCLTEPGSGSDALAAKTTARLNEEGTHYILNGTKLYITNAVFSDTFVVYAKVDGKHFTAFIVEKDFPGLSLGPEEKKMGIKGSSTRSVIFEDCLVPVENVLGEVGKGHVIAFNVLNLGRFNLGSACMGAAKHGLKLAVKYIGERQQFGRFIADFPASKEKVAKMAARIYAAESVQYRVAQLLEEALGDLYDTNDLALVGQRMMEYAIECSICKVYGSETLDFIADEAVQLHGGAGFIKEYKVEQMYRDSRINRIFEGTNEINRLLLPTFLFRKAAKGEVHLEEVIQKAVMEMNAPKQELLGPLEREQEAVRAFRRVFLFVTGLAFQTFGEKLSDEQEIVMKLSEIGIQLFAAESAVLRAVKAVKKNGLLKEEIKEKLAEAYIDDCVLEVEVLAKRVIASVTTGESRKEGLALVSGELARFIPESEFARKREIAAAQYKGNGYVC